MRPYILPLLLPAFCTVGAAQTTSVSSRSTVGVFAQVDSKTPHVSSVKDRSPATEVDPLAVRVDVLETGKSIAHARTKASYRTIGGLPAIRIYEAGAIPKVGSARQRAVGTSGTGTVGRSVVKHAWIVRFTGKPGQRVRVHVRYRSTFTGKVTSSSKPTDIQGFARLDIHDDYRVEFQRALDGKRYLDNHVIDLGARGRLDMRIETGARISSKGSTAASYGMTFDISLEPVRGIITSMAPFGTCGPDVYGITWLDAGKRNVRTILEGAKPSSPALLVVGAGSVDLPIPGLTCNLLTLPLALIPTRTNAAGRIVLDFPGFSPTLPVDVSFQYAVSDTSTTHMSKGLRYRVFLDRSKPYEPYDFNHVLSTGQSLAIGGLGSPVLSKTQPFKNLMFDTGLAGQSSKVAPLVESFWETMSSGMSSTAANQFLHPYNNSGASKSKNPHGIMVSVHAEAGLPYLLLKKGTQPFATGINQFRLAQLIAATQRKSYVVRCLTCVHGETDHTNYNPDYAKNLLTWQRDYETEIQSRGQTEPVPMLHTQMSSFTTYGSPNSIIPGLQLSASVANPRKLPLVGPKYFLEYFDGVHLKSRGYRHMGEYYGKVYNQVILEGATWDPLRPMVIRRKGKVITARFWVPEPPLVLDTSLVTNPGNYGFEYSDTSKSPPKIVGVKLVDEDTVEITLDKLPAAGTKSALAYAFTGKAFAPAGPRTGARGCLRDSDAMPSLFGSKLYNWAVHFGYRVN